MDMKKCLLSIVLLLGVSSAALAASVFTTRLDDPKAVYLTAQEFSAQADGKVDDSAAVQAAIDKAASSAHEGIVFVPAGRYRLTRTVYVWPGVRVIGYGATRPIFLLGVVRRCGAGRNVGCWQTRSVSSAGHCAAEQRHCRCDSQHILFGDE